MNYDTAKAIITEIAPDLIIDPDNGHAHIAVRKTKNGAPFSIALPVSTEAMPMEPEAERAMLVDAVGAAQRTLP